MLPFAYGMTAAVRYAAETAQKRDKSRKSAGMGRRREKAM